MQWSWFWLENIEPFEKIKSNILPFIKGKSNSIFSVHNVYEVKLLSRLRPNFSHLNKRKVIHSFKDGTNFMCDCGWALETTLQFFLQCQLFQTITLELLTSIYNLDPKTYNLYNYKLLHLLLFGSKLRSFEINREIIKLIIKFLRLSKHFERPLLWPVFPLPL